MPREAKVGSEVGHENILLLKNKPLKKYSESAPAAAPLALAKRLLISDWEAATPPALRARRLSEESEPPSVNYYC